ncbi:MAG: alpha-amylase family glycosyl hydrolase [Micrococcales bacterium]
MTLRLPKIASIAAVLAATALLLTGCSTQSFPVAKAITTADVGVQMNMWPFESLATECPTIAKDGYSWILVSPPQEDILGSEWWDHYQPVSYKIGSSLGTEAQFKSMIASCNKVGVQVVVDVVLNHMTGERSGGIGSLGTKYEKYSYPGLYTNSDFHSCPTGVDQIQDYSNVVEIQQCELLGLADLNTGSGSVRDKEAAFLKSLRAMGVAGFRIDAAKHIAASELKQIIDQLPSDTFIVDEVIGDLPPQSDYYAFSHVFSFDWVTQMHNIFMSSGLLGGSADKSYFSLLSPSDKTVTMVSNHDTERNGGAVTYRFAPQYALASYFTLAVPYGKPMMYSSYAFSDTDAGPLVDPKGAELPATCVTNPGPNHGDYTDGEWVCQHNWAGIVGMIAFHKAVGNADFANIFQDKDAYGFGRGNKGYVLFNSGPGNYSGKVQTGLAAGSYTDRISGGKVTVNTDGTIDAKLGAWSAVAIDVKSKG